MNKISVRLCPMLVLLSCTQSATSSAPAPVQTPATPATAQASGTTPRPTMTPEQIAARNDSLQKDRTMHVNNILAQIKGKEELPAEQVYQNIKILEGMTARRLLSVMSQGYSNSLGVSCSHCHVTEDFSKEEKPQKQVTRDMVAMVSVINDTLLKNIKGIRSENPGVNCSTCHNGRPRPGFGPQRPGPTGTQ